MFRKFLKNNCGKNNYETNSASPLVSISGSSEGVMTQRTLMKTKLMIIRRLWRENIVKFVIKSSEQVGI